MELPDEDKIDELAFLLFRLAGRPDGLWHDVDEYTKEAFRHVIRELVKAL